MKICLFCFVCYLLPVGAFGVQELIDTVIYHNEMIKVYAAAGVSCNTALVCMTAYRAQVCRNG